MCQYINYRHFYNPSLFAENCLMVSDGLGYEANPNFLIDRSYFNNQLIMYVLEGELSVEQYNRKFTVLEGEGIFLDLREKHKYYFAKNINSAILWTHLRGKPYELILEGMIRQSRLPIIKKSEILKEDLCALFKITQCKRDNFEYEMSIYIYKLIIEFIEIELLELQGTIGNITGFKYDLERYITKNIVNKFNLDEVAKAFNMSKYHFCRAFKEEFNETLFEYIKKQKIELAKRMLLSTNDSIAEIANYLNYCDQGYFTVTFKEIAGCTPKEFRLKNKGI